MTALDGATARGDGATVRSLKKAIDDLKVAEDLAEQLQLIFLLQADLDEKGACLPEGHEG